MRKISLPVACSILLAASSLAAYAVDDPEMDKIDMTPEARMEPRPGLDKGLIVKLTATVTAVALENRLVTIEGPDGNSVTLYAGDEVKNLPQVEVGDRVDITYYQAAAVDLVKTKGDVKLGTEVTAAETSAPPGARPAGALGTEVKRTVEVLFVDPIQKYVRVRAPDIGIRTITLKHRPDLQHYLKELNKGDIVQVTYTEAMAVAVTPAE
jgi:hypothetical protein